MPDDSGASDTDAQNQKQDSGQSQNDNDQQQGGSGTDPKAEAEKWKALARKHEANAKANAAAAKKLTDLENANKTELEKLNDKAAAAEERAAAAELRALRIEVASEAGVPAKLRKYVVGENREELEASAKEILEEFGVDKKDGGQGRTSDGRPKTNLRKVPVSDKEQDKQDVSADMNAWLRSQAQR